MMRKKNSYLRGLVRVLLFGSLFGMAASSQVLAAPGVISAGDPTATVTATTTDTATGAPLPSVTPTYTPDSTSTSTQTETPTDNQYAN
jgi:hypothetical protein